MVAGGRGKPLARRAAIAFVAFVLVTFAFVLPRTTAHAAPPPGPKITDRHSPTEKRSHGGGDDPSPSTQPTGTPAPTPVPTPSPTDPPPGSPPATSAAPAGPPGQPPAPGQPGAPPAGANDPAGAASVGPDPAMLGRQLARPSGPPPSGAAIPDPGTPAIFDMSGSIQVAGTSVPLWLIAGGTGLLVLVVTLGLLLTLRDREREPFSNAALPLGDQMEASTSVKFG